MNDVINEDRCDWLISLYNIKAQLKRVVRITDARIPSSFVILNIEFTYTYLDAQNLAVLNIFSITQLERK